MKRALFILVLLMFARPAYAAGGWTAYAVPTEIEIVRDQGFIIFGTFGNPGATPCTEGNSVFISTSHPQYASLLSTALSAVAGGLSLKAWVSGCTVIGWHGGTWNTLSATDALYVKR
jgi:hypothetical protein